MVVGFNIIFIYTSGITIVSNEYKSNLVVNNVKGNIEYKCSAENDAGSNDATCIVTVTNLGKASLEYYYTSFHVQW